MQQEIERYLLENPLLEREEEGEAGYSSSAGEASDPALPRAAKTVNPTASVNVSGKTATSPPAKCPTTRGDDDRWTSDAGTYSGAGAGRGR